MTLDQLEEACVAANVDPHKILAEGLKAEHTEEVGRKFQMEMAWKMIDKAEPSKKAISADLSSGSVGAPTRINVIFGDEETG